MYDYDGRIKLGLAVATLAASAAIAFIAWRIPANEESPGLQSIQFVLAVIAISLGFWSLATLAEWAIRLAIELQAEKNAARYPVILASKLAALQPGAIDILGRSTIIEILGMATDDLKVVWKIRSSPVDVDWTFAQEFISMSEAYYPHLAPVGRAYELIPDAANAERQAAALTNLLIQNGLAIPAAGNRQATLICDYQKLAEKFGVTQ